MKKLFSWILFNGVESSMSYGEQAKVKLINIAIVLALSNIFLYNFVYLIIDPEIGKFMVISGSAFILPIILAIYLISKKKYLLGKNIFLATSTLVILFTSRVYLGPDFGFQTYFLIFIVMPYVAFSNSERGYSFFYSVINMALYYYIQYGNYNFLIEEHMSFYENGIPKIFDFVTTLTAFSTLIIVMLILNKIIDTDEKILKSALEKSNYYAEYDYLTGAYNRRKMSEILEKKCMNFNDSEKFSLVMCDIDHFKRVNDLYGHPAGDVIIRETVDIIRKNLRDGDALGRWGGEEFLLIISDLEFDESIKLVESIRGQIEANLFYLEIKVTMSFGIAEYSSDKHYQNMIIEADNFMYLAKEKGRNTLAYKKKQ